MAIIQNKEFKDQLLIVDASQVGVRDRGVKPFTPNNAIIEGNVVDFHPMVRENWGTEDPLRGVLGSYYTQYRGNLGETLINYSTLLENLRDGRSPDIGAYDRNENGSERTGKLPRQLAGDNNGTNIIFNVVSFSESTGELTLQRSTAGWDSYETSPFFPNPGQWYRNKFVKYVEGAINPDDQERIPNFDRPPPSGEQYRWPGLLNNSNFIKKPKLDHTSRHYLISSDRSIRQASNVTTDIEPVYNFYVASNPDYEDVIGDPSVEEYLIANSYYLQLELRNTSSNYLDQYHNVALTIDNQVSWFSSQTNTEISNDSYYNRYSDNILNALANGSISLPTMKANNGDLAVLYSDLAVLNEDSIATETIPFYNKITIGYETESVQPGPTPDSYLQTLINDPNTKDFIDILQAHCIKLISSDSFDSNSGYSFLTKEVTRLTSTPSADNLSLNSQERGYPILFDLESLLNSVNTSFNFSIASAEEINLNSLSNVKFLKDYFGKTEFDVDPAAANEVECGYYAGNYLSKFKRTLEEVYNGDPCHTETLLYVVEKYRAGAPGAADELVQTFYISPKLTPSAPLDTVYYDSQIKYNQKYRYDIKKVVLVFGNSYQFNTISVDPPPASFGVLANYINDLSIKALLVPYSFDGIEVSVIDKPPVSPELSFYPLKGVDTRVKVLLNSSTGDYMDKPIAILDSDKQFIEEEYFGQTGIDQAYEEIRSSGSKIRYTSDDPVDRYQLFRINSEPTSYEDFNNNFVEINPDIGTPGYFEDIIIPNRKYYYCARSVDIHGNISNPTYIFEIEMFNNEGQIYLRQEVFTFKQEKPTYIKQGRRFIYIEPSFQQVALDQNTTILEPPNTDVTPQDGLLGVADSKCWQEEFKIRITSKKTGRKMDLNITFKNSGVTNPS
tara:strand:+ start:10362 stop:13058 length:2697 start_codon:yes stop_codon:yes gene_type:complete